MRAPGVALLIGCAIGACGGEDSPGDRATAQPPEQARQCLVDEPASFTVQGPLSREPDDSDAPDQTLVVTGRRAMAYLGYYDDTARAERSAREQREHARQFGGAVDRHGNLTIVWVRGRETDQASAIESCALS